MSFITTNWQAIVTGTFILIAIYIFFYYEGINKIPRGLILISIVLVEMVVLYYFWDRIEGFITKGTRPQWLKDLLPLFVVAIPAFLLWHWRDIDKKEVLAQGKQNLGQKDRDLEQKDRDLEQKDRDLEQKDRDLEQKDRDLNLKEENNFWDNFIKYQKMAEDKANEHSNATRAAAIYALGEYYGREGTKFPLQVHIFFKNFLDDFWDKQEIYHEYLELCKEYTLTGVMWDDILEKGLVKRKAYIAKLRDYDSQKDPLIVAANKIKDMKLPEYIKAVHEVIQDKSNEIQLNNKNLFHYDNKLSLQGFNLVNAVLCRANFTGANLRDADLTGANLALVNLTGAVLEMANFSCSYADKINLCQAVFSGIRLNGARITNAILIGTYFSSEKHLHMADFKYAKYSNITKFPEDFNPEKYEMVNIDEKVEKKVQP
ncbi:MAG: pentapeptide repeat-containing protein [Victivallaceae bacterium]